MRSRTGDGAPCVESPHPVAPDPDSIPLVDVTAVVVNWNTRDLLAQTLTSLALHGPPGRSMEVIVVDNGSVDDSVDMVRREWPEVRLIVNRENLGFTRANNQAIRASRGEYVLLINSDALLTPGCLDVMLRRMDRDRRIGAVGPRLVYGDGSWQRWTAGRAPSLAAALSHYLFLDRVLPGDPARGLYLGRDVRTARVTDWVCSACMVVRREALNDVGLLDESLFVYMDDVDLCQRLRDGGWSVWYCPEAEAVHYGGQTTERVATSTSTVALRAFNRYYARRHGAGSTLALKAIQTLGFGLRAIGYWGLAITRRGDPRLRAKAAAHWTYCRVAAEPRIER